MRQSCDTDPELNDMNTPTSHSPKRITNSFVNLLRRTALALTAGWLTQISLPAKADSILSGLLLSSVNSSGAGAGFENYNTKGDAYIYNLYVTSGGLNSPFINSGDGPTTSIAIPLTLGTHTYSIFGEASSQGALSHYGLNLFLNGSATPGISVFAPRTTSSLPPYPPFSANSSPNSYNIDTAPTPAAGTLAYSFGGQTITLTAFFLAAPGTLFNLDRVSPGNNVPSGIADFVGQFTLEVTAVPEPTSGMILVAGIACLIARKKKQ